MPSAAGWSRWSAWSGTLPRSAVPPGRSRAARLARAAVRWGRTIHMTTMSNPAPSAIGWPMSCTRYRRSAAAGGARGGDGDRGGVDVDAHRPGAGIATDDLPGEQPFAVAHVQHRPGGPVRVGGQPGQAERRVEPEV